MSGPKTLTIGITVNLEHYENLRLEVNGEVMDQDDARELARFLYDVLGTYGRGDPATGERIENFRRRVLPVTVERREPEPVPPHKDVPGVPEAAPPGTTAADILPPTPPHTPPSSGPVGEKAAESGVVSCEDCGAAVNQAEQKMSMLFASRVLCRKCLKKV